jgi:ubiquinone/menaquinone biosynthesis C-methylase UbiE
MTQELFRNKQQLFDLWAPTYDCLLTTVFYQAIHKRLLEYTQLPDCATILDLGCGTGRLLSRLATQFPGLAGTGLDLSREMLQQARGQNQHHPRLIYLQGNAESLPFAEGQFDAVFNTISFLHYPNPERVFSEVSRVLRPQGCFYLADYTRENISACLLSLGGLKFYSPQQREQLGISAGLQCLSHHYLLGGVLLSVFRK